MRFIIYPYKLGSQSARLLSRDLNAIRVRSVGRYKPRGEDFVINWGSSIIPAWDAALRSLQGLGRAKLLNKYSAVSNAANKLKTFRILQQNHVAIPLFTTTYEVASYWAIDSIVYAREKLTGHSGEGIVICSTFDQLPHAPLYVKCVINHGEYRVHVVAGRVIDYQKKRKHRDTDVNHNVRNLAGGWVYARDNLRRLERVEALAIQAVSALNLDFGAVDIIKDENGDVFVLEVNTACGMSETTLRNYVAAFNELSHA